MSGVSGVQVSINARVGQTVLIRCLDAAYAKLNVTLPMDAVIIAYDGRALGVPPYGNYSRSYVLPANTPSNLSVARRWDALIRPDAVGNFFATGELNYRDRDLINIRIPITVTP